MHTSHRSYAFAGQAERDRCPKQSKTRAGAGYAALEAGNRQYARERFQAVLEVTELAETYCRSAMYGPGEALWWLGDMQGNTASFRRACATFRRRPERARGAGAALRIGVHSLAHLANDAATSGWFARAQRLIEEQGLDGYGAGTRHPGPHTAAARLRHRWKDAFAVDGHVEE